MNSLNKTFLPTENYKINWFIIDCEGQKLGRLATIIVTLLKGKVKPITIHLLILATILF
jgi:large subunit ribosomal protein L13